MSTHLPPSLSSLPLFLPRLTGKREKEGEFFGKAFVKMSCGKRRLNRLCLGVRPANVPRRTIKARYFQRGNSSLSAPISYVLRKLRTHTRPVFAQNWFAHPDLHYITAYKFFSPCERTMEGNLCVIKVRSREVRLG